MKKLFYFIITLVSVSASAQVGIGVSTANIDASAKLEVSSTSKGFLAPRMSEAQKNTIDNPATGLLIYQTDGTSGFYYYDGSVWKTALSSVGAISPTSTANGASITAGELNLAPADENNGGIVTNVTQTFAGAKTFSDATTISNTTSSGSKTSGALVVNGGAGINENLNVGGTIKSGAVTYPNVDGTSGQVLTTNGAGVASWTTPSSGSGSSGSSLQSLSTIERDALGVSTSGQLVFNTDTNTFQGSKKILPPYDYYTSILYGYSAISPGHRVTQTFIAEGQTISSAKIAITSPSQFASNSGNLTFAIHDDVFDYDLFSTTITVSGTGDLIVPISALNWMDWTEGPLILPTGLCSFVISSDLDGGGSANFLLNGVSGVGTTINTLWQSLGPGYYDGPDTSHPLSIALYPKEQTGVIWVDISK